jgi:hypothetical protein
MDTWTTRLQSGLLHTRSSTTARGVHMATLLPQFTASTATCGLGLRLQGSGFRLKDSGCRAQGSTVNDQGLGLRVQGVGLKVQGLWFEG